MGSGESPHNRHDTLRSVILGTLFGTSLQFAWILNHNLDHSYNKISHTYLLLIILRRLTYKHVCTYTSTRTCTHTTKIISHLKIPAHFFSRVSLYWSLISNSMSKSWFTGKPYTWNKIRKQLHFIRWFFFSTWKRSGTERYYHILVKDLNESMTAACFIPTSCLVFISRIKRYIPKYLS